MKIHARKSSRAWYLVMHKEHMVGDNFHVRGDALRYAKHSATSKNPSLVTKVQYVVEKK